MRVIAGSRKSLPLKAPKTTGTRPTTDRIKETLFNILSPEIPGASFLDLFAGSGGIGIEALSRGASHAVFVENGREALAVIRENLAFTRFTAEGKVLSKDVLSLLKGQAPEVFDLVFLDPPYALGLHLPVLKLLLENGWIGENSLVIAEADLSLETGEIEALGYKLVRDKRYGSNRHLFLRPVKRVSA